MDIERYKKFALSKINEGNITKSVKSIIKNEEDKEQNYREGINPSINRRNLFKLNSLINDVSSNRSKYNIRDDIVDNLEMLNYNLLRLINRGMPPPYDPPAMINPPPAIDDDDDDDDDDDFVFPPPPPTIDDDEGEPFPTLPLPPPAPPEPVNNIIRSARENIMAEIRNPKLKLKPIPPAPPAPPTLLDEIRNPKKLKPPKPQKPRKPILEGRDLFLDEIRNPKIKLKTKQQQKPLRIEPIIPEPEEIDIGKMLRNTFEKNRKKIEYSSDEDEDDYEDWG